MEVIRNRSSYVAEAADVVGHAVVSITVVAGMTQA